MKIHPHDVLLQELITSPLDEHEAVIDHLVECADCQRRLEVFVRSGPSRLAQKVIRLDRGTLSTVDYSPVLDRATFQLQHLEVSYSRERSEATALLAELTPHAMERWRLLVRNSQRFHTWSFCDLLLRRGHERSLDDAALGEDLGSLGLELTDYLEAERYGHERIEDLRARACSYLGNARRLRFNLRGAEEAFGRAGSHLRRGTGEPMERAQFLDLRASLLRAQGRFENALSALRRVVTIYLEAGEKHRAGRALVKMSTVHHAMAEPEKSTAVLNQALGLIDSDREPRLMLCAWHNLIDDCVETGHFMEAQRLLAKVRPLYEKFPQPSWQNPRRWVEGKIALGLGRLELAEKHLLVARNGFLASGAAYDTAVISLDLASLYADQGRTPELKRLVEEMVPIFSSQQIHREVLAALAVWKAAVEAERSCLDMVIGLSAYVKRARYKPTLRFEVPE